MSHTKSTIPINDNQAHSWIIKKKNYKLNCPFVLETQFVKISLTVSNLIGVINSFETIFSYGALFKF